MNDGQPKRTQSRSLRLADIPFEETLPEEAVVPPLSDLLNRNRDLRQAAGKYWIQTTVEGSVNTAFHELLARLPSRFVSAFGYWSSGLARRRYQKRIFARRIARNLAALAPDLGDDPQQIQAATRRWWQNTGRTIAEFAKANHLWRQGLITLKGTDNLEAARGHGEPLIFVSMHLGTWEAAFTAIHESLAPPSIGPFQPESSRFSNRIVYRLRKKRNQYLFPPGQRTAIKLHKLLTAGEASLTIFIDEVRDKQVHLPLFGRPLPERGNAVVAVKLANASGGTIVPFYMKRTSGPAFDLNILPPIPPNGEGAARYDVRQTLTTFNDIFEPLVLSNIEHWYMIEKLYLPEDFEKNEAFRQHIMNLRQNAS
jgi:lauroyl/myristoyl acyltransferase